MISGRIPEESQTPVEVSMAFHFSHLGYCLVVQGTQGQPRRAQGSSRHRSHVQQLSRASPHLMASHFPSPQCPFLTLFLSSLSNVLRNPLLHELVFVFPVAFVVGGFVPPIVDKPAFWRVLYGLRPCNMSTFFATRAPGCQSSYSVPLIKQRLKLRPT